MKFGFMLFCLIVGGAALLPLATLGQSRDFLTDDEIEMIRDAQQIDQRIDVLTHAIDRRFVVLKINAGEVSKKESEKWGALPAGTRLQLLNDVKRILQKAIEDIDNLAERPTSMVADEPEKGKKPKSYAELFPKAVRILASATERYKPALKAELDKTTDNLEKGVILASLDMCEEITAAAAKLPAEVKKSKN